MNTMVRLRDRAASSTASTRLLNVLLAALVTVPLGLAHAGEVDWAKKRAALGREDKFRVLVDKVLSASNKWVMTGKFVDEIRDAGFNVVVPRVGGTDLKRVERVAELARQRGVFYMAWMRGTLGTKTGTKLVWQNGAQQDLYSPNTDELWDWMTRLILGHARLSAKNPAIIGTFLDYENYAKGKRGNCYALSYDEKILAAFAKAKELALPKLAPAERHPWLVKNGHLSAFRAFQIDAWRRRCRELRRQIDAINPRFQLIVYPMGTLMLNEAIYPEWGTQAAPLILADHITYHRPGQAPHAKALALNKRALEHRMRFAEGKNVPMLYTSGIDPIHEDADPEFCGRNAAMICDVCAGYWVFYEGPKYREDHPAYFEWFGRANRAVVAGNAAAFWKAPRTTPDPIMAARDKLLNTYCGAKVRPFTTDAMPAEATKAAFTVRARDQEAVFCVLLKAGERLRGRLMTRRLGHYTSGSTMTLYGPGRGKLLEAQAEIDRPATFDHPVKQGGLHLMVVHTGANAARLVVENQHFCLVGETKVCLLGVQPTAYMLPRSRARDMTLTLSSPSPQETAMLTVFDPTGREAAKGDTVTTKTQRIKVPLTPEHAGKPWSLRIGRASKGAMEDVSLELGDGCGRFLATHPSRLLMWAD